jgi:hypothetical protein
VRAQAGEGGWARWGALPRTHRLDLKVEVARAKEGALALNEVDDAATHHASAYHCDAEHPDHGNSARDAVLAKWCGNKVVIFFLPAPALHAYAALRGGPWHLKSSAARFLARGTARQIVAFEISSSAAAL